MAHERQLLPIDDRGPLRVMFALTSMPVGGAETLLVNLIQGMDRERFLPEVCCLKSRGPLGEQLAEQISVHSEFIRNKFDVRVLPRLTRLFRERRVDALVTVGAGDKMFWGRLAAWRAHVPVIASALHSTGWPDGVGRCNRWLTPITDAFIGVAKAHGRHLVENECFPAEKVHVIPNGIDVRRFHPPREGKDRVRRQLHLPVGVPLCGIVAALRPEKNHRVFLQAAARVRMKVSDAEFVVVGEGPMLEELKTLARELGLVGTVHFLGNRSDIPEILRAIDVFALSSDNEACPVSILEAMATELPIVATQVGSVPELLDHGQLGMLVPTRQPVAMAGAMVEYLTDPRHARTVGARGRKKVLRTATLGTMVTGYQDLIASIYRGKCNRPFAKRQIVADNSATTTGQTA
ncbi:MAG: glycosyltransferase [Pirellulaceae bacterium]|nr:glycosyltransferase [Planctomycetales bacterium]